MVVTFAGFNTHPGYAKGRMVNAIKAAARFIDRLPRDRLSPETTERYEGFVHPYQLEASVDRTSVKVLIRDFEHRQADARRKRWSSRSPAVPGRRPGRR